MDDDRTHNTLDALADLFLTGTAGFETPAREGASESKARPPRRKTPNPLTGPEPIRLEPKAATSHRAPPLPDDDPWAEWDDDDTPVLRLRRDDDSADAVSPGAFDAPGVVVEDDPSDRPQGPATPPAAFVEAVFLGNLPGLSGPWLTQYAQLLAQQDGPVAIIHLDDERIDVELVEPARRQGDTPGDPGSRVSSRMPPKPQRDAELLSTLELLLGDAQHPVRTILVHLDTTVQQPWLSRCAALDCWTVLCGADDAAVVGAYRSLKQMAEADERIAEKNVGLMVMGSDRDASRAAAGKVRAAAESFLTSPVELVGWQQQMVPVNLRQVGSWEGTDALWPALEQWLNDLDEPAEEQLDTRQTQPEPKPEHRPAEPVSTDRPAAPTQRVAVDRDQAAALHAEPAARTPESPAPELHCREPGPTEPQPNSGEAEPELASFLTAASGQVPGGIVLEARCPQQPQTQLLLDDAGRLHLLRRSARSTSSDGDTALRAAIVDLIEVRRWVRDHLKLLQLTQRQCRFDHEAEPVLHLFTDRADRATTLVAQLGPMIKLHLLQSVAVGDQRTWFCTALS